MRKEILVLCSLFVAFVFYSCNNDEAENPQYLDNKLIEGTWYGIYGKDSMVYSFKDNEATYELYAHILGMDTLKYEGKDDYGKYLLTDSLILLPYSSSKLNLMYKLSNHSDSLYIRNPIDDPILWLGFKKYKK